MTIDLAFNNAIVLSSQNEYRPIICSVGVESGVITVVKEDGFSEQEAKRVIDCTGKVLMPGLVNAHCHGDMTVARGLGDDLTLLEQMSEYEQNKWFSTIISDEDRFYSRQLTYIEALLSGTTFMMENMFWSLGKKSVDAMKETGIQGALAEDIRYDFMRPNQLYSREQLEEISQYVEKNGLLAVYGSISEEDFSYDYYQQVKELIGEERPLITSHLAEAPWRMEIVQEKFSTTPVRFLKEQGVLGKNYIGSHLVYVDDEEVAILAQTETKVVNTPLCEMKIADGIAPIVKLVKGGVTVALGSDGGMWNNSNDIFREMKGISLLQTVKNGVRSLTTKEVLDMGTINGAKVFGLEKEMGLIKEGYRANIILLDVSQPHFAPLRFGEKENISSSILFNATGRDVTDVFVAGQQVVKDRQLMTVDVTKVIKKVVEASNKIAHYYSRNGE